MVLHVFLLSLLLRVARASPDVSFRMFFDVAPPSLVRVIIETPYVAESNETCPTAYLFDFQDPVETVPPADDEYPRRAVTRNAWLPLTHYPYEDKVGKPRSACGNYDFSYASLEAFKQGFGFPDFVNDSFAYSDPPPSNQSVWNGSLGVPHVPAASESWWTIGTPSLGRVNYTMGYWDLMKGYHKCRDYATGVPLVSKRTEPEPAYFMGLPYYVDTYEWEIHLCGVSYTGPSCRNTAETQIYAKTCTTVPVSFTVAPQQVSSAVTDAASSTLMSKTFLHSVRGVPGGCDAGYERIAIVFQVILFDTSLVIIDDDVHSVNPRVFFEATSLHDAVNITNATEFSDFSSFAGSDVTREGIYKLKRHTIRTSHSVNVHQNLVLLTRCFYTGYDARLARRSYPQGFSEAVASSTGIVEIDIEVMLRRRHVDIEVRNTMHARIVATKESFLLSAKMELKNEASRFVHKLYGSYESARDNTGVFDEGVSDGTVFYENDQICSKHQSHFDHASFVSLSPSAVAMCVLSPEGLLRADGHGVPVAGRTVSYRTSSMTEPATFTFGCKSDWIDFSSALVDATGVYRVHNVTRLPKNNHERTFWMVWGGAVNEVEVENLTVSQAEAFGVGLFHYDDIANAQRVQVAGSMQMDQPVLPSEELSAGCYHDPGMLRASCNLACFTLTEGLVLNADDTDQRVLMIQHISVAENANSSKTESTDRFVRRSLSGVSDHSEASETQVKMLRIRRRHAESTQQHEHYNATEEAFLAFWVILTTVIVVSFVVFCVGHLLLTEGASRKGGKDGVALF